MGQFLAVHCGCTSGYMYYTGNAQQQTLLLISADQCAVSSVLAGGRADEGSDGAGPGGERWHRHEHRGHLGRGHRDRSHSRAGALHPARLPVLQVRDAVRWSSLVHVLCDVVIVLAIAAAMGS